MLLHLNMYVILWPYLAQFFLEWDMFHTKVVQNIKTQIFGSIYFLNSCRLWDKVEKYYKAIQAIDDNTAHARCMLDT